MILKLAAISVLLGVCFALPVEDPDPKVVEVASADGLVPLEPKPGNDEDLPKPPKPDDSDLKTDASTWWHHNWHHNWHHEVPVYYYPAHNVQYVHQWRTHY